MKRLRVFFALILVMLFFPYWRGLDYIVILFPSVWLYTMTLSIGILLFLLVPLSLILPQIPKKILLLGWFGAAVLVWFGSPLSGKATRHYESRHCGFSTFTGFFYHAMPLLPPAHQDDLEVRNQMCWVRKMVSRLPSEIDDVNELKNYLDLLRQKLLSPPRKYKATLPLIAALHGTISTSLIGPVLQSVEIGQLFVDSLHFWKSQYTIEISELQYPWYAWPHSAWIKWEYGIIEKNWESIVSGIQFEN